MKLALAAILPLPLLAATINVSKPEDSGMSAERLARIRPLIQRHIAAKDLSGAVTVVARKGKVVHFEAHGLADIEANKPMQTATLFPMPSLPTPSTPLSTRILMAKAN